jgi:hypothetical protein
LDKLAKLKRHADSAAEIGSLAEAEAFAALFQRMLLKHKLEATDLEFAQEARDEPVGRHPIDYDKYPDVKVRATRVEWIEKLAGVVARAHFCQILVHPRSSQITLLGRRSDAAVAEYMIITLQRAAERLATAEYTVFTNMVVKQCAVCLRDQRDSHPGHVFTPNWQRARGFKAAFLQSFIVRLHERYRAERAAAATSSSTALVRLNTAEAAVSDFLKREGYGKATKLARSVSQNLDGHRRGRAAADRVNLRSNAVGDGTVISRLIKE